MIPLSKFTKEERQSYMAAVQTYLSTRGFELAKSVQGFGSKRVESLVARPIKKGKQQ